MALFQVADDWHTPVASIKATFCHVNVQTCFVL